MGGTISVARQARAHRQGRKTTGRRRPCGGGRRASCRGGRLRRGRRASCRRRPNVETVVVACVVVVVVVARPCSSGRRRLRRGSRAGRRRGRWRRRHVEGRRVVVPVLQAIPAIAENADTNGVRGDGRRARRGPHRLVGARVAGGEALRVPPLLMNVHAVVGDLDINQRGPRRRGLHCHCDDHEAAVLDGWMR